jgi:hypothetical protein
MLVRHDAIEPHRIGQGVLFMVLVVQDMGLVGVEIGVGKIQTPRGVLSRSASVT